MFANQPKTPRLVPALPQQIRDAVRVERERCKAAANDWIERQHSHRDGYLEASEADADELIEAIGDPEATVSIPHVRELTPAEIDDNCKDDNEDEE